MDYQRLHWQLYHSSLCGILCYLIYPGWNKPTLKPFWYNNLTIHIIWVCCIDSMSLSHPLKPRSALFLNKKYRCTVNVMTVKIWENHCRMLFCLLLSFITQQLLLVFFSSYVWFNKWITFWWQNIYFSTTVDKYLASFVTHIPYLKLGHVLHPQT